MKKSFKLLLVLATVFSVTSCKENSPLPESSTIDSSYNSSLSNSSLSNNNSNSSNGNNSSLENTSSSSSSNSSSSNTEEQEEKFSPIVISDSLALELFKNIASEYDESELSDQAIVKLMHLNFDNVFESEEQVQDLIKLVKKIKIISSNKESDNLETNITDLVNLVYKFFKESKAETLAYLITSSYSLFETDNSYNKIAYSIFDKTDLNLMLENAKNIPSISEKVNQLYALANTAHTLDNNNNNISKEDLIGLFVGIRKLVISFVDSFTVKTIVEYALVLTKQDPEELMNFASTNNIISIFQKLSLTIKNAQLTEKEFNACYPKTINLLKNIIKSKLSLGVIYYDQLAKIDEIFDSLSSNFTYQDITNISNFFSNLLNEVNENYINCIFALLNTDNITNNPDEGYDAISNLLKLINLYILKTPKSELDSLDKLTQLFNLKFTSIFDNINIIFNKTITDDYSKADAINELFAYISEITSNIKNSIQGALLSDFIISVGKNHFPTNKTLTLEDFEIKTYNSDYEEIQLEIKSYTIDKTNNIQGEYLANITYIYNEKEYNVGINYYLSNDFCQYIDIDFKNEFTNDYYYICKETLYFKKETTLPQELMVRYSTSFNFSDKHLNISSSDLINFDTSNTGTRYMFIVDGDFIIPIKYVVYDEQDINYTYSSSEEIYYIFEGIDQYKFSYNQYINIDGNKILVEGNNRTESVTLNEKDLGKHTYEYQIPNSNQKITFNYEIIKKEDTNQTYQYMNDSFNEETKELSFYVNYYYQHSYCATEEVNISIDEIMEGKYDFIQIRLNEDYSNDSFDVYDLYLYGEFESHIIINK